MDQYAQIRVIFWKNISEPHLYNVKHTACMRETIEFIIKTSRIVFSPLQRNIIRYPFSQSEMSEVVFYRKLGTGIYLSF